MEDKKKINAENEQIQELSQEEIDKVAGGDKWDILGEMSRQTILSHPVETQEDLDLMHSDIWAYVYKYGGKKENNKE